jgi:hypothetical protein
MYAKLLQAFFNFSHRAETRPIICTCREEGVSLTHAAGTLQSDILPQILIAGKVHDAEAPV